MTGNVKYNGSFQPINNPEGLTYFVKIHETGYTGDPIDILLSGIPIVHEWQEDEPIKAIKGSTLKVNIINNGVVSLDTFYSDEDTKYWVELYEDINSQYLFRGYLLQEDCAEIQVDFAHEITLTFTDNLGLLKSISLGQAAYNLGSDATPIAGVMLSPGGNTVYIGDNDPLQIGVGDTFYFILGFDIIYTFTVKKIIGWAPGFGWEVEIVELSPVITVGEIDHYSWRVPIPLNTYLSIREILYLCLASTNVITNTNVMSILYPVGGTTGRWIDDTYLDGRTFFNGNDWDSCYEVLEKIMTRFNATLFQAKGEWYIVRWGELALFTNPGGATLIGYKYLSNMAYDSDITEDNNFEYGNGNDIEYGIIKSITRPYKFTKETFKFRQLGNLLCNADLQDLGSFRTSYTVGSQIYEEYEWECWTDQTFYPLDTNSAIDRYIRVITDIATNKEVDRYGVIVRNYPTGGTHSAQSAPIQITKGDVINFSFSFRSQNAYTLYTETNFKIVLHTSTQILSFGDNQSALAGGSPNLWTWQPVAISPPAPPPGVEDWYFSIFDGYNGDSTTWMDVNLTTLPAPEDGILYVYLSDFFRNVGDTYYKNLQLSITNGGNNFQTVTGQTHTDTQTSQSKNNDDIDIYMDDCLSSTVSGVLYLPTYTSTLRNKTTLWNYTGLAPLSQKSLGGITTFEKLFLRYLANPKYEGALIKVIQNDVILSPLAVLKILISNPNYLFIFGSLTLDYKSNIANATIWYMVNTFEAIPPSELYEFKYLYENN